VSDGEFDSGAGLRISTEENSHFGEARFLYESSSINLTTGLGYFDANIDETINFGPFPATMQETDSTHKNAYLYADLNYLKELTVILGLSGDDFEELGVEKSQINPKIGIIWSPLPYTTFRAAAFRTLKRTLTSSQTIEPTQIAGFNQFFDDVNGTDAWRYGMAIDQTVSPNLFLGAEISRRYMEVPVLSLAVPGETIEVDEDETFGRSYIYWAPADWMALSAEYQFEQFDRDVNALNPEALIQSTTHRIPLELRFFHPGGTFARVRGTFVDQDGQFESSTGTVFFGSDRFFVVDASLGYRFPRRLGLASIEVRNLFDTSFSFQDSDPTNSSVSRERLILAKLKLSF